MADFGQTINADLEGKRVRVAPLVKFDFVSGIIRLWNGVGRLDTQDGQSWQGIANMGDVGSLDQSYNGDAPSQTFRLSGVDADFANIARGNRDEYYRQPVTVYLQFFDEDWQTLDNPFAVTLREMQQLRASKQLTDGGEVYTVEITAETPFTIRRRPPSSYYTDRDQQLRYPGDRGCEYVANIDGKSITFPDY